MNLRTLILVLLVANLAIWAWSRGAMNELGLDPRPPSEPLHMQQQLHPEALELQPLPASPPPAVQPEPASQPDRRTAPRDTNAPTAAMPEPEEKAIPRTARDDLPAPEETPAPGPHGAKTPVEEDTTEAPVACLQAGPFDPAQARALRRATDTWPASSWQLLEHEQAGRWMVYLGDIGDELAVRVRRSDLTRRGVDVDSPGSALEPGLSLGRYSSPDAADQALAYLTAQGIEGLRVVVERKPMVSYTLRLPRADGALRQSARQLPLAGKRLQDCG